MQHSAAFFLLFRSPDKEKAAAKVALDLFKKSESCCCRELLVDPIGVEADHHAQRGGQLFQGEDALNASLFRLIDQEAQSRMA